MLNFRDAKCNFTIDNEEYEAYRMCNTYWRSQELLQKHQVESFILGMVSQIAEREDHILVEDLRGNYKICFELTEISSCSFYFILQTIT